MHDDICISQYPSAISRYCLDIGWKLNFKKYIDLLSKFNKKYDEIKDYCNSGKLSCRKHNLLAQYTLDKYKLASDKHENKELT